MLWGWYLGYVAVLSVLTFMAYAYDKWRATGRGSRVPEFNLQMLAFLGGWPGALAGQYFLRHKTHKLSFQIVFWILVVIHIALVALVVLWWPRSS